MYLVEKRKDGKQVGFLYSGRPSTIRVYESIEEAKRGIAQKKAMYDRQGLTTHIVEITILTEVKQ